MQALQSRDLLSSDTPAMDQLSDFLRQRRDAHEPVADLDAFAQELPRRFVAAAREALGQELSRCALDVPTIAVAGERYHRLLRGETTSHRAVGPVRVARSLSRHPHDDHALCPRELRAGIIAGSWTPWAAQQATWVGAHVTPTEGEALCALWGNMTPPNSPLARWPQALRVHGEAHRPLFAATLRPQEAIPPEAVAMAVSLDGVRAPMQDGERQAKRQHARAQGQSPSGPAGYQEGGGAPVSSYDRDGGRLCTRRMARMPETTNATLKSPRTAEVRGALGARPDVRRIKVADGAPDHWSDLSAVLPLGQEGLAFSQAAEPLGAARGAASGEGTPKYQER